MLNDERCKMISSSREKGFGAKEEEGVSNEGKVISKGSLPLPLASSSRQWSGLRNPRIVRVSRSFGGKDRHSKVCTIRGLRDRRIRLSVPTAIQLYDLQDRLGLSQPSKVIDWLLDNTKNDIDKLPPLQMPQGFGQFQHQMMLPSQSSQLAPFFDVNSMFMKDGNDVDVDHLRAKSKQIERESPSAAADHKGKWVEVMNQNEETQDGNGIGDYGGQEKLFSIAANHSAGLMMNNAMPPFSSYYHWEPSTLSLSQFGNHNHGYLSSQTTDNFLNVNNTSVAAAAASPSSLALPSAAHATQLFFCPPSTMPSLFPAYPPYGNATMAGSVPAQGDISDSKQINYFQLLNSNSQHVLPNSVAAMKPFSLNVNAGVASHTHQNDDESHADDEDNTES